MGFQFWLKRIDWRRMPDRERKGVPEHRSNVFERISIVRGNPSVVGYVSVIIGWFMSSWNETWRWIYSRPFELLLDYVQLFIAGSFPGAMLAGTEIQIELCVGCVCWREGIHQRYMINTSTVLSAHTVVRPSVGKWGRIGAGQFCW